MNEKQLVEKMVDGLGSIPTHAEVFAVRQHSLEEITRRAKRFLGMAAEVCNLKADRGDWVRQENRTLVRLPMGGRAVIYHPSGAMKLSMGLNPMESLFPRMESRETLTRLVQSAADRLRISEWAGARESLNFEKLWQVKAGAADRQYNMVEPVLCRVVGAYRHVVGKLPVLGAASVAVKVAGSGAVDSLSVDVRETTGEPIEWAPIVRPDVGARQILTQLASLMGRSEFPFTELAAPQWMGFGYISMSKRNAQRVLAPHYIAAIGISGQPEAQAYQFVVPATEKTYQPLCQTGVHPPVGTTRAVSTRYFPAYASAQSVKAG